jgi:hypothetical protein
MTFKSLIESAKAVYNTYFRKTKIHNMVRAYRLKTRAPLWVYPQEADQERVRICAQQVSANAFEVLRAVYGNNGALLAHREAVEELLVKLQVEVDTPRLMESLGGLDYMTEYTRQEFGVDGLPIIEAIHSARLAEPMQNPKIREVLVKQGWIQPLALLDEPGSDSET